MGKKVYKYDKVLCKKVGKRINYLRKDKNMTQEELAYSANISPSYLSAIERGITDTTISTIKRLSKALTVTIQELFEF